MSNGPNNPRLLQTLSAPPRAPLSRQPLGA